jgi:hypothetical protein
VRRFRVISGALALLSVLASTALSLTWSWGSTLGYRETVWGELVRALTRAHSRLRYDLASNVFTWVGVTTTSCAIAVVCCACLAFATAWPIRLPLADWRARPLTEPAESSP